MRVQFSVNYRINFLKRRPRRDRFVRRNIEVKKKGDSQLISIGSGASIPFVHISCECHRMSERKRMRLGRKFSERTKDAQAVSQEYLENETFSMIETRVPSKIELRRERAITILFLLLIKIIYVDTKQRERMYILYIITRRKILSDDTHISRNPCIIRAAEL